MRERIEAAPPRRLGQVFHDTLSGYLRALSPTSRRFWLLVPCIGALAGLSAVGGVHFLSAVQALAWGGHNGVLAAARRAGPLRRVLVPAAAGVLVVAVGLVLHKPPEGHGTSQIIEAIWVRRGRVPVVSATVRGLLNLIVVAMGASLGREGALIYFGAAVASWLGRRARLPADQVKLLVACGASAGMAAVYNTPIGAAFFGLEVFLGGLQLELYGPIIFASVTATLISRALLWDHPSYVIPPYRLQHPTELAFYLALGLFIGLVSGVFVRTIDATTRLVGEVPRAWRRVLPIASLLVVGGVGVVFPQVYGNGYDTVNLALAGRLALDLLLVLPALKLMLSSLCASTGVPGALFTPSMFVGGLAGGAFGVALHHLVPDVVPSAGGYVIVGMGAILAGSTHATLAAALMMFEMTGSYGMILPLLASCVVSTAVSRLVAPESIYTAPLKRRGVELPRLERPAWMQREGVRSLVRAEAPAVRPRARLDDVVLAAVRLGENDELYVVDDDGRLRGAISLELVRDVLADDAAPSSLLVAADLMRPAAAISVDASLWEVTRRALGSDLSCLAVLSPREGDRFVGTIAIADVLAAAAAG